MLDTIQQFIIHTPWWVFSVLVLLIYHGIMATQTQIVSISKLFIFPLLLIIISGHTIFTITTLTTTLVGYFIITVLFGSFMGWYMTKTTNIQVDHDNGLMQLQGSGFLLWMLLIIFCSKYYQGYIIATNPDLASHQGLLEIIFAINGICIGLLLGRFVHLVYCYKTKPTVRLTK
jgi:hypothetical protein